MSLALGEASPAASSAARSQGRRRLNPRIVDTDWLVLRRLRRAVSTFSAEVARPGDVVVDFGSGEQPYGDIFTGQGCRYLAADFGHGGDLGIDADGRLSAADASADGVGSFQVLEHVRDLRTYFTEARRVLKADGWMILSTHGTWLYHPHPEDHRRWTRTGLAAEIGAHGFDVVSERALVGPLAWTILLRLTCFSFAVRKLPVVGGALSAGLAVVMNTRAWIEDQLTPAWVTRDNACVYVMLCRRSPDPAA